MFRRDRLRRQLADSGVSTSDFALFRPVDPETAANVAGAMFGAAAIGGGGSATGRAIDRIMKQLSPGSADRRDLPHRVLVAVSPGEVDVFAANRDGAVGARLATYREGQFRAHVHRYPGAIELTLDAPEQGRMVLHGEAGFLHRTRGRVAGIAAELGAGPAH